MLGSRRVSATDTAAVLRDEVGGLTWYHTLELPGGVVTPGEYDLRPVLDRVPLPDSLEGKRCLDVGTHDGFWAYEMERRGAAEVIALDLDDAADLDWPTPGPEITEEVRAAYGKHRQAFDVAHRALGSSVQRRSHSVYALSGGELGHFDFATIGTLLLHLRDPVGALTAIQSVLAGGGQLLCNEAIGTTSSIIRRKVPRAKFTVVPGEPFWWMPNVAGLSAFLRQAGFEEVSRTRPYLLPSGAGVLKMPLRLRGPGSAGIARQLVLRRGMPHVCFLVRAP